MTVQELIDKLSNYPKDKEVRSQNGSIDAITDRYNSIYLYHKPSREEVRIMYNEAIKREDIDEVEQNILI